MRKSSWLFVIISLLTAQVATAVEGFSIRVETNDVVLTWGVSPYEPTTWLIQYRASLNDAWQTLNATFRPASTPGNTVSYRHTNVVVYPAGATGSGGSGGTPSPFAATQVDSSSNNDKSVKTKKEKKPKKMDSPPLPWDPEFSRPASLATVSSFSALAADPGVAGFYRVLPVPDFYVNQEGAAFTENVFIPITAGDYEDSMWRIQSFEVLIDGESSDYVNRSSRIYPLDLYTDILINGLELSFDRISNGNHTLQLRANVLLGDDVGANAMYVELTNKIVNISIASDISFSEWDPLIVGNSYSSRVITTQTVTPWVIDLYDSEYNLVTTQSGTTSNGIIDFNWNLIDLDGNSRTNLETDECFYPVVTIGQSSLAVSRSKTTRSLSASQTSTQKAGPVTALDYPKLGGWLVTRQDCIDGALWSGRFDDYINAIAGAATLRGMSATVKKLAFGTNVTQEVRNQSWDGLKSSLYQAPNRNFYYNGHGSGYRIGGDYNTHDASGNVTGSGGPLFSGAGLDASDILKILVGDQRGPKPYRFVFLDGCSTAKGWLSPSFKIPKQTNNLAWYQSSSRKPKTRPSAFVGWNEDIGGLVKLGNGDFRWGTDADFLTFRQVWLTHWTARGETLIEAFNAARDNSNWAIPTVYAHALSIFGYQDLRYNEYNKRSDWP